MAPLSPLCWRVLLRVLLRENRQNGRILTAVFSPLLCCCADITAPSADVSADKPGLSLGEGLGLGAAAGTLGAGAAAIGLKGDKPSAAVNAPLVDVDAALPKVDGSLPKVDASLPTADVDAALPTVDNALPTASFDGPAAEITAAPAAAAPGAFGGDHVDMKLSGVTKNADGTLTTADGHVMTVGEFVDMQLAAEGKLTAPPAPAADAQVKGLAAGGAAAVGAVGAGAAAAVGLKGDKAPSPVPSVDVKGPSAEIEGVLSATDGPTASVDPEIAGVSGSLKAKKASKNPFGKLWGTKKRAKGVDGGAPPAFDQLECLRVSV